MPKELQIPNRETELLLAELKKTLDLSGDVVEFGCYEGDTSILLADVLRDSPDKWLYLYDSFEGLPEKTAEDKSADGWRFQAGELKASPDTVRSKFKKYDLPEPVITKGWFDQLENSDLPNQISFALLDGDFYNSIKTSLELVAPRLVSGGIIVVHDYRNARLPGSGRAVNEFLGENAEDYVFRIVATMAVLVKK
ncbi:class I SAM-dependent methyltransferase [Candidatus Saccharibacteria bacterium]|nr:class I SAM-dependent methyltransferase [Candidatus Saccharibacteria bacterium]